MNGHANVASAVVVPSGADSPDGGLPGVEAEVPFVPSVHCCLWCLSTCRVSTSHAPSQSRAAHRLLKAQHSWRAGKPLTVLAIRRLNSACQRPSESNHKSQINTQLHRAAVVQDPRCAPSPGRLHSSVFCTFAASSRCLRVQCKVHELKWL